MTFHSEFQEDQWISENIQLPTHGRYVDVGCAWPDFTSNTAFLRSAGWHGLAIDGNIYWQPLWESIKEAQFIHAVIGSGIVAFGTDAHPVVSRIKENGTARQAFSLESILEEHGLNKIDFLSLDVEGSEYDAFRSMEFEKHSPSVIVSEFSTHNPLTNQDETDNRLRDHLLALGYTLRHTTHSNYIFTL